MPEDQGAEEGSRAVGAALWVAGPGTGLLALAGISYLAFDSRDLTWNLFVIGVIGIALGIALLLGLKNRIDAAPSAVRWSITAIVLLIIAASGVGYLLWPSYHSWWIAQTVSCVALAAILVPTEPGDSEGQSSGDLGGSLGGPWGPP